MIDDLTRAFRTDDVDLAWDRWGGAGTPLFLCHGYSGSTHDFAGHIEGLAERRGVVAVDHRGHGRSPKLGTVDRYSIYRLVADLIALIEHEVSEPVDLLGHSMGGAIGLRVVLSRPDLVRSLILMDTSAWSFAPLDPEAAQAMSDFMERFDPSRGLPNWSRPNPEDALIAATTSPEWQAMKADMAAAFDPYALKALGLELFDADTISVRGRLGEITCPVTVIVGSLDEPFASQAADLAAEVADGTLITIPNAFHSPQLTHPTAWADAVESHLARVSPPR